MVLYFLVYVDDMVLIGSNATTISHLIRTLSADFPFKNLGALHYFLGVDCHHAAGGLFLSQYKYILDLLRKTNMHNCKPVTSSMATSTKMSAFDSILWMILLYIAVWLAIYSTSPLLVLILPSL